MGIEQRIKVPSVPSILFQFFTSTFYLVPFPFLSFPFLTFHFASVHPYYHLNSSPSIKSKTGHDKPISRSLISLISSPPTHLKIRLQIATMKFITSIILSTLIASSFALPATPNFLNTLLQTLGLNGLVGNGTPLLATTIHSPECANLNGGTYVCCESTLNGGMPIVEELSELTDYPITKNTINGLIACASLLTSSGSGSLMRLTDSMTGKQLLGSEPCYPGTKLCCGSIALVSLVPSLRLMAKAFLRRFHWPLCTANRQSEVLMVE
jgi:hypothetical protein